MNIELSVKEENGVVKIKITSPNQPVVMEIRLKYGILRHRMQVTFFIYLFLVHNNIKSIIADDLKKYEIPECPLSSEPK